MEDVPSNFNPRQRKPPYALMSDLQVVSERLEELQMEDTASGARPGQRRNRRGRKSASTAEDAEEEAAADQDAYSHLTPRVRQFVRERVARKAEREKVCYPDLWPKLLTSNLTWCTGGQISAWLERYGHMIRDNYRESAAGSQFDHKLRKERIRRYFTPSSILEPQSTNSHGLHVQHRGADRRRGIVFEIFRARVSLSSLVLLYELASLTNPKMIRRLQVWQFRRHPLVQVAEPLTDEGTTAFSCRDLLPAADQPTDSAQSGPTFVRTCTTSSDVVSRTTS